MTKGARSISVRPPSMRLGENSITGDLNMPRGGGGEGLATAVEVGSFAGTGRYVYTHIYTSRSRCDEDTDVITFTQYKYNSA